MLDVPADNLTCRDNMVVTKCECKKSVSMTDLAHFAMYKEKVQVMENASHWNTDSPPPFCAQFAEVEVDTETGHIRVIHLVTAVDLGVAINPMQAEGQAEGAVAQSLGYALTEEMVMNASGRVINPSFIDYKMIRAKGHAQADHDSGRDGGAAGAVRSQVDLRDSDQRAGAGGGQCRISCHRCALP